MTEASRPVGASDDTQSGTPDESSLTKGSPEEYEDKLVRLHAENKNRRLAQRELERKLKEAHDALAERDKAAEAAKLQQMQEQEQWKELAELRAKELDEYGSKLESLQQRAHEHLIKSHLRAKLASSGIKDQAKQDLLMPGILAQVEASVSDDFAVEGDFSSAIQQAAELLGINNRVELNLNKSAALTGQLPTSQGSHQTSKPKNVLEEVTAEIAAGLLRG